MPAPCPAPFNLTAYVLEAGRATPDKPALETVGGPHADCMTYGQLSRAILGTATGLRDHGLRPGDRLLIRLPNTVQFPILYLAAIAVDILPIAVSAQLTAPEVARICALAQPRAMAVTGDATPLPRGLPNLTPPLLDQMQSAPAATPILGDPDRAGYIVFTSGTSGQPKGVIHAHRAIWARRQMWHGWYGLTPDDRMLHAGAFNWTYTLGTGLLDPWSIGATAIIPDANMPRTELAGALQSSRATIFAAAPGVYRQMLRAPIPQLPSLRHGLSAGESLAPSLRQRWQSATGTDIHEAYGLSECSTFLSGSPQTPAPQGYTGYPQPGRLVRVTPDGHLQIHHSEPGLMLGTLNGAPLPVWVDTGDMAELAADGAIRITGRTDDMLNAGGFRVSPLEIEAALEQHPAISEAAAVQVQATPDTTLIAAFYSGTPVDEEALKSYCADRLARYKCPHSFTRLDRLPRGANNKLHRHALRTAWGDRNGPS